MGLIVDNFCGAGGASTGIAMALREPDYAINHDPHSIEMHTLNHPKTHHFLNDVWGVDPRITTKGRGVDLAWFSPDCRHFSRAKGGTPVKKNIRDLAWVAVKWTRATRPEVVVVENVPEFLEWGPLIPILNEHGEPLYDADGEPLMRPDPDKAGETFAKWVRGFRQEGYSIDWRELCAADYGAPTIRKRLFVVARRDGAPIQWPRPTHSKGGVGGLKPWVGAHTIIDWDIPCPSIFDRKRPLADNTCRRIAYGLVKYVIDNAEPFIVRSGHTSSAPGSKVKSTDDPLSTIMTKNSHMLVSAFMAKHYGGKFEKQQKAAPVGHPFPTITSRGTQNQIVVASMTQFRGSSVYGHGVDEPVRAITAQGQHHGLVSAFLTKYYSSGGQWQDAQDPLHTIPTKGRFGLVTCRIRGDDYVIADVGMRMLTPYELSAAQGFPSDYRFVGTKTDCIARIGNSVVPIMAAAVVAAQFPETTSLKEFVG